MKNIKGIKTGVSVFELDGIPSSVRRAAGLQHVVAMIVGCVTPAIIVAGVAIDKGSITAADEVILVQSALLIAGIATLIQMFPIGRRIGAGLPVIMGVSFAYLASLQAIAGEFGIAAIFGRPAGGRNCGGAGGDIY